MIEIYLLWVFMSVDPSIVSQETSTQADFDLDTPLFKAVIEEKSEGRYPITIFNYGPDQWFTIRFEGKEALVSFERKGVQIKENEAGSFVLNVDGTKIRPGVYSGSIIIESQHTTRIVPVILEVQSSPSFDASATLAPPEPALLPGGTITFDLTIYPLRSPSGDITLSYFILDAKGEKIASKDRALTIKGQTQLTERIELPATAPAGEYALGVQVRATQDSSIGTASVPFHVVDTLPLSPPEPANSGLLYAASAIIFALIFAFLIINYYWRRRVITDTNYWDAKLKSVKKLGHSEVRKELEHYNYQKHLLEDAYKKKYITKDTYNKTLGKISRVVSQLKKRL